MPKSKRDGGLAAMKPSQAQERRWQAEQIVRVKLTQGPEYEQRVKKVLAELKKLEKKI